MRQGVCDHHQCDYDSRSQCAHEDHRDRAADSAIKTRIEAGSVQAYLCGQGAERRTAVARKLSGNKYKKCCG